MAKRFARKVKRAGKAATQFRFTSTFEYVDLTCNGTWRPGNLRIIWLRSHRRVQSSDVEFVVTEDRGPNGADGRAVFDPPINASLIVTLYRDSKKQEFEEKEYKYYIENEDKNGKKILASFNCDMAEYSGTPSSRHALEMNFKPVSRKITKALLGITLESEFVKEGKDTDDDMQSTFSSVDPTQSVMYADDEDIDDDELDEAATLGTRPDETQENQGGEETNSQEPEPGVLNSLVLLGTGETRRRSAVYREAKPSKPPRKSMENLLDLEEENDKVNEATEKSERAGQKGGAPETCGDAKGNTRDSEGHNDTTGKEEGTAREGDGSSEEKKECESEKKDGESKTENEEKPCTAALENKEEENSKEEKEKPCTAAMENKEEKEEPCTAALENKEEKEEPCTAALENKEEKEKPCTAALENKEEKEKPCTAALENKEEKEKPCTTALENKEEKEKPCTAALENKEEKEEPCTAALENKEKETTTKMKEEMPCGATPLLDPPTQKTTPTTTLAHSAEMPRTAKVLETGSSSSSNGSQPSAAPETSGKTTSGPLTSEQNRGNGELRHPGPPHGGPDAPEMQGGGANPFDEPPPSQNGIDEQSPPPSEPAGPGKNAALISSWLPDAQYIDCNDTQIGKERVDSADVIGLYFSAQWCPPCRRFLPKLLEFYTSLKKNNKSFEMIYISNDNSRTEMIQYMAEQQMPWVAIPHGHPLIDKLKLDFKVRSIPLLVIVGASGETLDDNAKKAVEGTHVAASSTIKQYNKWLEKTSKSGDEDERQKVGGGGGIIGSIKKALSGKDDEGSPPPASDTHETKTRESAESKSHKSPVSDKFNKDELVRQLQQKEDIIRHLQEVNQSLKVSNDELNTEVSTLKSSLQQTEFKVKELETTTAQKKQEDAKLHEHLKVQGWLFKKGAKGPTANVFRRRYFRLDQGSKLYYYKSQSEGTPQGFIDLVKVIDVNAVEKARQDKNNGSFNINCEGRVFELLAHDESEMTRWIEAVRYLADYYKTKGTD